MKKFNTSSLADYQGTRVLSICSHSSEPVNGDRDCFVCTGIRWMVDSGHLLTTLLRSSENKSDTELGNLYLKILNVTNAFDEENWWDRDARLTPAAHRTVRNALRDPEIAESIQAGYHECSRVSTLAGGLRTERKILKGCWFATVLSTCTILSSMSPDHIEPACFEKLSLGRMPGPEEKSHRNLCIYFGWIRNTTLIGDEDER